MSHPSIGRSFLYCDLCAVTTTGETALQAHLEGKAHRKLKERCCLQPNINNKDFYNEKNMNSVEKDPICLVDGASQNKNELSQSAEIAIASSSPANTYVCDLCSVTTTGQECT